MSQKTHTFVILNSSKQKKNEKKNKKKIHLKVQGKKKKYVPNSLFHINQKKLYQNHKKIYGKNKINKNALYKIKYVKCNRNNIPKHKIYFHNTHNHKKPSQDKHIKLKKCRALLNALNRTSCIIFTKKKKREKKYKINK
ncbi:hypothetical protein C923_02953 [Plasmodium falciparum UGT5.1]|nr:hypothetical protein C923_02953 [Plasmodium falciparum UGT5.1]EWC85809.1 hypothetical protein PFNF54_05476 [Plasmodium falciparum NF54]